MLRWMTLFALVAMVAFVGCGPDGDKADTPDDSGTPAGDVADDTATDDAATDDAADDSAATDDEDLSNIADEFANFAVDGGSSASAQRDGGAQ